MTEKYPDRHVPEQITYLCHLKFIKAFKAILIFFSATIGTNDMFAF